ncbi:MAG: hypothetical protein PHI59_01765 [Candidatus Omnitrophica bacterium]|nr:hypothetical protein [Candidatus Omnitrophota bacterium]
MIKYTYAKGRLLDAPNTYFYTPYYGIEFINAWKADRLRVLRALGKPIRFQGGKREEAEILLRRLVQKFEVTKHVDNGLYVETAEIFEAAYAKHKKLTYLNALLKIIDTLCSISRNLDKRQKQRLAWLILREFKHVSVLGRTAGVSI